MTHLNSQVLKVFTSDYIESIILEFKAQ